MELCPRQAQWKVAPPAVLAGAEFDPPVVPAGAEVAPPAVPAGVLGVLEGVEGEGVLGRLARTYPPVGHQVALAKL